MKKYVCGYVTLILALAIPSFAQLVAGSPEDALFRQISGAATPDEKISLGQQFEQQFGDAPPAVMASVFTIMMSSYEQMRDYRQALAYGEKIVQRDPENVNAYMSMCRFLSVNLKEDLSKAIEYGERAVSLAGEMKDKEAPPNYTAEQWDTYTSQTETYARSILTYARTVQP